ALPVIPLRNTVLFPGLFLPLSVGRASSVAAVEAAMTTEEKNVVLVAQRDAANEEPGLEDLHTIGVRAVIKKMARSESSVEVLVQGAERVVLVRPVETEPYLVVNVRPLPM